jgi:hypothetical protein
MRALLLLALILFTACGEDASPSDMGAQVVDAGAD